MKEIVIDASVALKWFLADEEYGQKALELLKGYVSSKFNILAPVLLEYEVLNGLNIARRRSRVKEEDILATLDGFANLGIEFYPVSILYPKVLDWCKTYDLSAYDASYVALAESKGVIFVTADKRLYNAVKKVNFVKWIGDTHLVC